MAAAVFLATQQRKGENGAEWRGEGREIAQQEWRGESGEMA